MSWRFFIHSFSFLALFFLDRLTKLLVVNAYYGPVDIWPPYLSFELVINRGISWSLLNFDDTACFVMVSSIVTAIGSILFVYACLRYRNQRVVVGELLVLVGAWSNIVDRIMYGGVIDFILFKYGQWSFPVFNLADITIVAGVVFMMWESHYEW